MLARFVHEKVGTYSKGKGKVPEPVLLSESISGGVRFCSSEGCACGCPRRGSVWQSINDLVA